MPLTVPVDEAIVEDIETLLAAIDDVTVIRQRKQVDEWTPEDLQIVLVKKSLERLPEIDCPGNPPAIGYEMEVQLRLHRLQSERDDEPLDVLLSTFVADVMAAITASTDWYNWSGNAIDSEFGSVEFIDNDGGFDAALLPLKIKYRFSESNPYEPRS